MTHQIHNVGAAKQIGRYSAAIEVKPNTRWLLSSGTPGVTETGTFPEGIEAQSRLAWTHIMAMLEKAGMTATDLVKVTASLISAADIPGYVKVRKEFLGDV
jgi:2-iminobutanoate/2-iminopropanoate deaminase